MRQARFHCLLVLLVLGWGTQNVRGQQPVKPTSPVDLTTGPQLFVDDYLIASAEGIKRVTQHPTRSLDGPILGWREHTTQPYVAVLRDPASGLFRMWYNYNTGLDAAIAYAE